MTIETSQLRASRRIAAAAVALTAMLLAPSMASAASGGGGTITFAGALTAPSMRVSALPAALPAGSSPRVASANTPAVDQASAVALTFKSSPGVVSGADVALQMVGATRPGDTVAVRFVDHGGRSSASPDGHYRIGRDGGVLSMSPERAGAQSPVIVVVSYD